MHPISYQTVDIGQSYRLRGTNQQTDTGMFFLPPSFRAGTGPGGTPHTLRLKGVGVGGWEIQNRTGGAAVLGLAFRIPNDLWIAGQWTDGAFVDDTTDAQDVGASDFALESFVTNDGYVIASSVPFNAVSILVGTADVGGARVRALRFSNAAGDGWDAAPGNLFIQDGAAAVYTTGEQLVVFGQPPGWGRTAAAGLNGIPADKYALNVRSTTPPITTVALATAIEIFMVYYVQEGVADGAVVTHDLAPNELRHPWSDGLAALVARATGAADDQSRVTAQARSVGA